MEIIKAYINKEHGISGVNQSKIISYYPQGNGVVERKNRISGDALKSLLLGHAQKEWDTVLLQIMWAYRSIHHTSTGETPNLLMLGQENRIPDLPYS